MSELFRPRITMAQIATEEPLSHEGSRPNPTAPCWTLQREGRFSSTTPSPSTTAHNCGECSGQQPETR
eukprot:1119405-Pyramimonas_sp.AAC.1